MNKTQTILLILAILLTIPLTIAVTITGQGSSYAFTVENCTSTNINDTINCTATNIQYTCDISPVAFINNVTFRIDNTDYIATQTIGNPTHFYLNYNKPLETTSSNSPITMDRQQITDVDNHKVNAYETIQITHNCEVCDATYNTTALTNCQIDNTYTLQHLSNNETCAPSYNTTEYCNYCNANIIANYTDCDGNGTTTITYTDLNYTTCCLQTGLAEDCQINTPTYETTTQSCNYLTQQFTCTYDTTPVLNEKINVNCEVPTDENYCCVLNIYQGTNFTSLLATSPEYKNTNQFSIIATNQETRTCFTPTNRLLNAYYTQKELRGDTEYLLEAKCSSINETLKTQYVITPTYKTPDQPVNRIKWMGDNAMYIVLWLIIAIVAFIIIIYAVKKWG